MIASQLLLDARTQRQRLTEIPLEVRPADEQQAYSCQARLIDRLTDHYGGSTAGYKIACTNTIAQRLLNMPGPFYGRLLSAFFYESPATLRASDFFMRVIEAEFGFQFARDLPAGLKPASREEIVAALAGVLPAIEIVDSRFASWTTVGAASLISDNACHGAWVKGALVTEWQGIDLAAQAVELRANGVVVERGSGSAVLGHPLNALEWLVHRLHSEGTGLRAGEYVTTGVATDIHLAQSGDHVEADFGAVGRVEINFS